MKKANKPFMNDETFARVQRGFEQAAAHAQGQNVGARVTTILVPPTPRLRSGKQVAALRHRLKQSQSGFARLLNVSVRTVQAWEQDARTPSDAALKLLAVAEKHPEALFDAE